ncbi:MAG: hypothetical protein KDB07_11335, partial [Planctomycetes bacterium]|nr:hypothetical protein [Planctomycetota bacterium]
MDLNATTGRFTFTLNVPAMQTVQMYMIPVTVTDSSAATAGGNIALEVTAVPNVNPQISSSFFNPASVAAGAMTTLTLQVSDGNNALPGTNDIMSVKANLTTIGGAADADVPFDSTISGTIGQYTLAVNTTGLAANTYTIPVTVTDNGAATAMANVMVQVTNALPDINSATFSPASLQAGGMTTLTVEISDANSNLPGQNDLSSVTVNLSAIGGSAAQALTFQAQGANAQTATYTVMVNTTGATPNSYNLAVTAADASGNDMENAALTITAGNVAPTVGSTTTNPTVPQQGQMVTITATIADANSSTPTTNDIASVIVDLSAFGLAPNTAMEYQSGPSTGNNSIYNLTFSTFGMPIGTHSLPFIATDMGSLTVSGSISLTIADVAGDRPELLYEFPAANSNNMASYQAVDSKIVMVFSQ